jgi:predicted nucleic acid-binding protein
LLTYCDSSALVVLLQPDEAHREPIVTAALGEATDVTAVDWISPLEVTAAIHRSLRTRERRAAEHRWWDLWSHMVPVVLDGTVYEAALEGVRKHRLRSLAALHLAAAIRIGSSRLLTFDAELGAAARREGIEVIGA